MGSKRNDFVTGTTDSVDTTVVTGNRVATFHSFHPRTGVASRASYTIPGVAGNIVIFLSMFADGVAPPTLTLDADLAMPKADGKQAKAEAAALKAIEKAEKVSAKIAAQAAKAEEKAAKAQAVLDAAQAKIDAAKAAQGDAPTA
jgi:hypothetical protein